MNKKTRRRSTDPGQVIGAVIFIALLIGLVFLGLVYESSSQFSGSFFEDISKAMQWK